MSKITEKTFNLYSEKKNGDHLKWKELERKEIADCKIFKVEMSLRESTDGRQGHFVSLNSPDWVTMIPIFTGDDNKQYFIMEKQFRHGTGRVTVEFPAGLIEKGEKPEKAAERELLEETGIRAKNIRLLGSPCPNSAFMNNTANFLLMSDLELVQKQNLDPNEQIDVVVIPVQKAIKQMGEKPFDNGVMMTALGYYLRDKMN